jgi:transcriptional regulator with XRE-family HTH domain
MNEKHFILFPQRIKTLRNFHGLSMDEFSKKIGVSKQSISRYEMGEVKPTIETMESICKAFDLPITFFTNRKFIISCDGVNSTIKSRTNKDYFKNISFKIEHIYGQVHAGELSLSKAREITRNLIFESL